MARNGGAPLGALEGGAKPPAGPAGKAKPGKLGGVKAKPAMIVGGVAAAAAAAFALRKLRAGKGDPTYIMAPAGRNDSTSSDLYNLLQPEIEYLASQLGKPPASAPTPTPTSTGWDKFNNSVSAMLTSTWAERGPSPYPPAGMAFLERQNWQRQAGLPYVTGEAGGTVYNPATGQKLLASVFNTYPEARREALTLGTAGAWSQLTAPAQ